MDNDRQGRVSMVGDSCCLFRYILSARGMVFMVSRVDMCDITMSGS